ncbi:amidohydrolase [Nocardioides sp. GY 10113]|uniref:amidohydrolase family protein n=1 Tax=Nocardioides sp. GY 10113 TaxID=2569761 RepID=UPI0010A7CEDA|nr:amidohydrolase family protein [Nocardioides sp. GY 10113]TIC88981.1 amidohydrolase [Nocardioides sp. GY 10113]
MAPDPRDAFEEAYAAGVPGTLRRPAGRAESRTGPRSRDDRRPPTGAPPRTVSPETPPSLAPTEPTAYGGSILMGDGSLARGWVVVEGDAIAEVRSTKPRTVEHAIATEGVILPGLIDLHGHPEYNVFAAWEPPRTYINRGQWRGSDEYAGLVKEPWAALTHGGASVSIKTAMTRYAEVRAAVGGVTAIQGASKDYPNKAEALVRNVDLLVFGDQVARSTVDVGRLREDDIESIRAGIFDTGTVKAHYVHLAEGQKTNDASVREFERFAASPLFSHATVMIHGTALTRDHFDQLAAVGGKLVWSPQSNLRLYDETTDVAAALAAGLPVALGADWMPSGSPSLLHELKIAQEVAAQTPELTLEAPDLVRMITSGAAEIAGLGDRIGTLAAGRPADLTILQKRVDDPYDSVVAAYPSWVDLVMIGGDVIFGRPDWVAELTGGEAGVEQYERVTAWGRHMLLDTRFGSPEDGPPEGPPRRLAEIRARLIARYPAVGPIFA